MITKIISHFQKKRQAKRRREQEYRFKRNRKIGRHHPLADIADGIGDFIEDAIKWD